jgi:hypothetical protein
MRLYVDAMDAVLVEFDTAGRVKFDGEDWSEPTLQESRAILHAAEQMVADGQELIDAIEASFHRAKGPVSGSEPE